MSKVWRVIAVLALAAAAGSPGAGQMPSVPTLPEVVEELTSGDQDPPAEESATPSEDDVERRRAEVEKRLAALRRERPADEDPAVATELEQLERIARLLSLQLAEIRRTGGLEAGAEQTRLDVELKARLDHPPPYSVDELDTVLDELDATRAGKEVLDRQISLRLRALEAARGELDDRSRELRRLQEEPPPLPRDGSDPLRALELERRLAEEQVRLREIQLRNDRRELEVQSGRERELERIADRVEENVQARPEDLEAKLEWIAAEREAIARALETAREETRAAEAASSRAQDRLEVTGADDPEAAAIAEIRLLDLDAAQAREEVLTARSEQSLRLEELWRLRFEMLGGNVSPDELTSAETRLAESLVDLERERRLVDARLEERRLKLRLVEARQDDVSAAPIRPLLAEQRDTLYQLIADYEEQRIEVDRLSDLTRRVLSDVRQNPLELDVRLRQTWRALVEIWDYEITTVDSNRITVGKIVLAIILMVLGYLASKAVSHRLGRSVFPRLGLASGAAAAFQTLIFYFLLVAFMLWALRLVSIPLTVFTVLGGVVAIGVGFGSQNIVNNFISGLIILAERPIKIGDLIEVDGVFGQVERIGPRSSRVRSGDNTHIIVPNSVFLENNVLNWTVSDDVLRSYVDVGLAYGSPVEQAAELLERAVSDEPSVLKSPPPEVLFMEFGDNALVFRAYFWLRVQRPLDRFRAQSKLRFRIDALFREAGIVIAFPQRDVHIDSLAPLDVRLLRDPAGDERSAPERMADRVDSTR